jgi:Apea-like HEPN/ApeA N-terminal domain 1
MASDYAVAEAYIGAHFDTSNEPPRFRRVQARYSHLPAWVQFSTWLREHRLDVSYDSTPQRITWNPDSVLSVAHGNTRFSLTSWMASKGTLNTDVRVRRRLWLELETPTPLAPHEWHRRFLYPFRHFLTLLTTAANSLESFTAILEDAAGDARPRPVSVFNDTIGPDISGATWLPPSDMLIHLGDIESDFRRVLDQWFVIYERLRPICDSFFSLAYNPPVYVDQQFLGAIQAAEAYHREAVRPYKIDPATHERRVNAILASAPDEHREWLRDVLAAAGEPSLRERLGSLLERTDDVIGPLLADRSAFLRTAILTRHQLTHPVTRKSELLPGPNAIYRLYRTLSFILRRCLLHELGFTSEQCQEFFARNRDYAWAKTDLRDE